MSNGRDALHQIDASIADLRRGLARAGDAAASDARALADLDQRQVEIFNAIADVRLDHLKGDAGVGGSLGAADRKAEELIARHQGHIDDLAAARDAAAADLVRLEGARREAEAAADAALARHDAAAAATRQKLETDPDYRTKADTLDQLNAMAARAEGKLAMAQRDRSEKGAAYEADPLFRYLRDRKFATGDYRAFPLFAFLDARVARLIRYRDHRLNYERLLEIPVRFSEHLDRLRREADDAADALEETERNALLQDGVGALRDAAGQARNLVETLDRQIADAEAQHARLAGALADAADGKDGPIADARALIADKLTRASIPDLKILAAETATPEDDRLVDALVRAKRERMELEETRKNAAASLGRQSRNLSELEDLRRRFKTARYDSPYSEFSGRDAVAVLIAEFLRGAMNRDDVWRRIERGHKTRRREWDYDLGGDEWRDAFGLPDNWGSSGPFGGDPGRRTPPTLPGAPRRTRAPRPPRIPRMPKGGGGFKTGGGF